MYKLTPEIKSLFYDLKVGVKEIAKSCMLNRSRASKDHFLFFLFYPMGTFYGICKQPCFMRYASSSFSLFYSWFYTLAAPKFLCLLAGLLAMAPREPTQKNCVSSCCVCPISSQSYILLFVPPPLFSKYNDEWPEFLQCSKNCSYPGNAENRKSYVNLYLNRDICFLSCTLCTIKSIPQVILW